MKYSYPRIIIQVVPYPNPGSLGSKLSLLLLKQFIRNPNCQYQFQNKIVQGVLLRAKTL